MDFPVEFLEKVKLLLQEEWFQETCTKLNIYNKDKSFDENLQNIKEYILIELKGKINIDKAIKRFLDNMEVYKKGEDFERWTNDKYVPDGFIKTDLTLPISDGTGFYKPRNAGFRTSRIYIRSKSEMNILKNKQKD